MPEPTAALTVLAFDFGTRQIGTAIGQSLTGSAAPLKVLRARDGQPQWQEVEKLIAEWQPQLLLVGLPLNMDGSESEFCTRARKFARRLHGRTGLRVLLMDERLSTREAKSRGSGRDSYREQPVDDMAAQIILESWFAEPEAALAP